MEFAFCADLRMLRFFWRILYVANTKTCIVIKPTVCNRRSFVNRGVLTTWEGVSPSQGVRDALLNNKTELSLL